MGEMDGFSGVEWKHDDNPEAAWKLKSKFAVLIIRLCAEVLVSTVASFLGNHLLRSNTFTPARYSLSLTVWPMRLPAGVKYFAEE